MHSNFLFLVDLDSDTDDIQEKAAEAIGSFECRFESKLDENNWYKVWGVYLNNTTYVREDEGDDFVEAKKDEDNDYFFDPFLSALRIAAIDLRMYDTCGISIPGMPQDDGQNKINSMTKEELIEAIITEVPNTLSELYKKAVGQKIDVMGFDREAYTRYKLSRGYELFINSHIYPFTVYTESPYVWRCFDARSDSGTDFNPAENAIVMVDIHT